MENKEQEFNMDKYNDFLSKIKAGSPVHKINFTLEHPNAVVGMYLITMENVIPYLDKVADYTDLNNDTLLVFESRHVIECCQIIYGCLSILDKMNMLKYSIRFIINKIIESLLTKPSFNDVISDNLHYIAIDCINVREIKNRDVIVNNLEYILKTIWFIPYGRIDEIAKEAIDEFKKQCGEGGNNE